MGSYQLAFEWVFETEVKLDSFGLHYTYSLDKRREILEWLLHHFPNRYDPVRLLNYLVTVTPHPDLIKLLQPTFPKISPKNYFATYLFNDIRDYYSLRDRARAKGMGDFLIDTTLSLAEPLNLSLMEIRSIQDPNVAIRSLTEELQRLHVGTGGTKVHP
jgi:hypothetical protein